MAERILDGFALWTLDGGGEGEAFDVAQARGVRVGGGDELLEEGLARVPAEAESGFAHGLGRALRPELLALEVAVEGVEEEAVVRNGEPVKDFLLLLRSDAVELEQELEELGLQFSGGCPSVTKMREGSDPRREGLDGRTHLGLLECSVCSTFEVPEVAEDTLLKFLRVAYGPAEGEEAEVEGADDVGSRDVVMAVPEDAGNVLARREEEAVEGAVLGRPDVLWRWEGGGRRCEEELELVDRFEEVFGRVGGEGGILNVGGVVDVRRSLAVGRSCGRHGGREMPIRHLVRGLCGIWRSKTFTLTRDEMRREEKDRSKDARYLRVESYSEVDEALQESTPTLAFSSPRKKTPTTSPTSLNGAVRTSFSVEKDRRE